MDQAYEGDETRDLGRKLGYVLVVPPNPNRLSPWEYGRVMPIQSGKDILFTTTYDLGVVFN